ncbi:winged helix-turn-helix transcriptional regulator [Catellatospora bangladeshensis]|uniref:HxlR family transcriptional regulator n=1 Tax=Catellatospora bangladeshensis TaxID=310355 RepID=A0A8J3NLD7_9ACTN|nr:winged helix-turn-helix transcriptional regulator [Catellatospora bangladeshensis]GIF83726.1 HxlR family transcriptional regulator [Catellatospora bangladeshensis]
MPKRMYGQLCPIARSLDVLGERWTLLIVRELLLGPKRFKELLALLPATGTNRLAERLQLLERSGVVTRRAVPGATELRAYELTEYGERLRPLLAGLAAWGAELPLDDEVDPDSARADLMALYLTEHASPGAAAGLRETWQFHVGDEVFHVTVADGRAHTRSGPAPVPADLTLTCGPAAFDALTRGTTSPADATASGALTATGDLALLDHPFRVLRLPTAGFRPSATPPPHL